MSGLFLFSFCFTIIVTTGWTIYACMKKDYFIFWANMPGLVLGLYYCLSILPFLSKKVNLNFSLILLLHKYNDVHRFLASMIYVMNLYYFLDFIFFKAYDEIKFQLIIKSFSILFFFCSSLFLILPHSFFENFLFYFINFLCIYLLQSLLEFLKFIFYGNFDCFLLHVYKNLLTTSLLFCFAIIHS